MERSHHGIAGNTPRLDRIVRQMLNEQRSTVFGRSYDLSQRSDDPSDPNGFEGAVSFVTRTFLEVWAREADPEAGEA